MQHDRLTWKDVVATVFRELGGEAHLSEINRRIEGHPKTATNPTWQATIRRVVRQYNIFAPVPPKNSGIYRLVEMTVAEPQSQHLGHEDTEMNHGIVQGMLVNLGNIYGYETYVPGHDQTVREFQGQKLSNLVTVKQCDDIFRGPNLSKVREIDVLWFDEDDYGLFPVYAFEAEHTTRVKGGMDRLLKIPTRFRTRFFVLAPTEREEALFNRLVSQTPFRSYQDKFAFRLYSQLEAVYNTAVKHESERRMFGLTERYGKI